jgi:dihydroxyacetone kinase
MKESPLFTINWRDVTRGLIMAVITPVLFLVQQTLETGSLQFNWQKIGMVAVAAGVGYVIKNFLTPATPTKTVVETPEGKVTQTVVETDQVKVNVNAKP